MTIASTMRGGAVAVMFAGALLVQGCTSPDPTMTAQGTRIVGTSGVSTAPVSTGPYSGEAWYSELDAAMTSDNGGE